MKLVPFFQASLFLSPLVMAVAAQGQSSSVCPTSAVFLAITDYNTGASEVRGYPTRANGPTLPCQVLQGPKTTLSTANGVAISIHGNLHVVQFLTNGTADVFFPDAHGNAVPDRVETAETNDLLAIATDARVNDFLLSRREGPAIVVVVPQGATIASAQYEAPGFQLGSGLAVDTDDNLVVAGYDNNYNGLIETLGTSASLSSPAVVRTISGPDTGLLPGSFADFSNNQISIAVDPVNGELYAYNYNYANQQRQISVFPPHSAGNVKPIRVIAGPLTQIGVPGELNNKIAVSSDGRLFVSEANGRILVFSPGVNGNVAPAQIIQDSTIGSAGLAQGGIGVRSCQCK